jgi:hypothetical protein
MKNVSPAKALAAEPVVAALAMPVVPGGRQPWVPVVAAQAVTRAIDRSRGG